MNPSEKEAHSPGVPKSQKYIEMCRHPTVQALKRTTENTDSLWLPTAEELQELLHNKLPYPDRSSFQRTENGWEYKTYFREWAADYGTYIDTYRQFSDPDPEIVLLQVLTALLGIDGRWMV